MTRYDFTNDARTLGEIALAHPDVDHFHCVDGDHVFHYDIERNPRAGAEWRRVRGLNGDLDETEIAADADGNEVIITSQSMIGASTHESASGWDSVVGDTQ